MVQENWVWKLKLVKHDMQIRETGDRVGVEIIGGLRTGNLYLLLHWRSLAEVLQMKGSNVKFKPEVQVAKGIIGASSRSDLKADWNFLRTSQRIVLEGRLAVFIDVKWVRARWCPPTPGDGSFTRREFPGNHKEQTPGA